MFLGYSRIRSVGNYAVGAKTIEHVRDVQVPMMFANMDALPASVVCAFGTNNLNDDTEVAWAKAMQVYATLAHRGIRPVLTTIPPNFANGAKVTAWNAKVTEFAAETGLPLIDRYTPIAVSPTEFVSGWSADGVHPNDVGHREMGVAIAADAALAAHFTDAYPDIDTTAASAGSTDVWNIAGNHLWNNFDAGKWDVSAWAADTGNRYWLDTAWTYGGSTKTCETLYLIAPSGARDAYAYFPITNTYVTIGGDVEVSMLARINAYGFAIVWCRAEDSGGNALGSDIPLLFTFNAGGLTREGMMHTRIKAPAGTTRFRFRFNVSGTSRFGAITARPARRLG